MNKKVIVVLGPTATGKSALGIWLAEKFDTEIISGDSMLVYRGFDIGAAKPGSGELARVRHHLVDVMEPDASYSAAAFQQQATELITSLHGKGKIPLVVGGTGLYLKALLEGYKFSEIEEQPKVRRQLEVLGEQCGGGYLFDRLRKLSPVTAEKIHPHNKKRLIRALEVVLSGEEISREKNDELVFDAFVIGLTAERQKLYHYIDIRVEKMFEAGLVNEVARLVKAGVSPEATAMRGIGYKEVVAYLFGELGLDECKKLVAKHTRNFAKRQFTWYKKMPYINWFDIDEDNLYDKIFSKLVEWGKVE